MRVHNTHGPISGSGPNFQKAMAKFAKRQAEAAKVGVWRKAPCSWKHNDGSYIDPDWYIVGEEL